MAAPYFIVKLFLKFYYGFLSFVNENFPINTEINFSRFFSQSR